MQRVTITLDDELMADLDRMIEQHGYQNRSEAIRDFARAGMQQATQKTGKSQNCVAALVYVYDHAARDLSTTNHHCPHAAWRPPHSRGWPSVRPTACRQRDCHLGHEKKG